MNYFFKIYLLLAFIFCCLSGVAQEKIDSSSQVKQNLFLISTDNHSLFNKASFSKNYQFEDTSQVSVFLNQLIDSLHQAAFLTASVDSIISKKNDLYAYLFMGKKYDAFNISNANIDVDFLKKVGLGWMFQQTISFTQLQQLQDVLLETAENQGYPFAAVQLKNVRINKKAEVNGKLFLNKGPLIRIAGIKIQGEGRLHPNYLEHYLNLKKNSLFQKNKIESASKKLQELPFIKETRSPSVLFKENEATVNLFLAPKKVNRFDFLIGVLPNNQETGKVLITGNLNADFHNQFGKGERLHFKFEQLRPETQQLLLESNFPYLLNTPLGLDTEFALFKRDSTYRDLIWNIGFQYLFEGNTFIKAFSKNTSSALLTIDEKAILANRQLPANLDLRKNTFGLAYQLEKLDYRFNPRAGWLLAVQASAGFKEIRKNNKITDLIDPENPNFDFASLYDALPVNSFQYQLEVQIDKYFPLQKRSAFKTSIQGASIISETPILQNEQFQIGGNQRLRGFDEASIFATSYLIGTLEYRYLLSQNSYFFLFGDFAYIENKTNEVDLTNRPIGIGLGMTFETKAGLFGISYALGKLEKEVFEFKRAKVHFGFVSLF